MSIILHGNVSVTILRLGVPMLCESTVKHIHVHACTAVSCDSQYCPFTFISYLVANWVKSRSPPRTHPVLLCAVLSWVQHHPRPIQPLNLIKCHSSEIEPTGVAFQGFVWAVGVRGGETALWK